MLNVKTLLYPTMVPINSLLLMERIRQKVKGCEYQKDIKGKSLQEFIVLVKATIYCMKRQ